MHYEVIDNWLFHSADFIKLSDAKKYIKRLRCHTSDSYIVTYVRIRKIFDDKNCKTKTKWRIPYKLYKNYNEWTECPDMN